MLRLKETGQPYYQPGLGPGGFYGLEKSGRVAALQGIAGAGLLQAGVK
ncbi:MAG TPA: hypothetical protein VFS25_04350 [Chitinophaga sp.]|nr:hypothetical protein [Chitinophaga sp.]HEU4552037.1 hypothetical protein [Chitinophaga sp.]